MGYKSVSQILVFRLSGRVFLFSGQCLVVFRHHVDLYCWRWRFRGSTVSILHKFR